MVDNLEKKKKIGGDHFSLNWCRDYISTMRLKNSENTFTEQLSAECQRIICNKCIIFLAKQRQIGIILNSKDPAHVVLHSCETNVHTPCNNVHSGLKSDKQSLVHLCLWVLVTEESTVLENYFWSSTENCSDNGDLMFFVTISYLTQGHVASQNFTLTEFHN